MPNGNPTGPQRPLHHGVEARYCGPHGSESLLSEHSGSSRQFCVRAGHLPTPARGRATMSFASLITYRVAFRRHCFVLGRPVLERVHGTSCRVNELPGLSRVAIGVADIGVRRVRDVNPGIVLRGSLTVSGLRISRAIRTESPLAKLGSLFVQRKGNPNPGSARATLEHRDTTFVVALGRSMCGSVRAARAHSILQAGCESIHRS